MSKATVPLVSCNIHAHHQTENCFTCGFNYSYSPHSSATASCKVINFQKFFKNAQSILRSK
uniref:Uncharacterized protein n=1 Tax=Arundo donax TaxID=35708 RepID=A0A0A9GLI1_ARUDO